MALSRYDNPDFSRGAPVWQEALRLPVRGTFLQMWGLRGVVYEGVNVSSLGRLSVGDPVWPGEDVGGLSLAEVVKKRRHEG